MVTYPKDWKVQPIKDAVDIYQGGTPKTTVSEYWNGSIIWITPGEITKLKSLYVDNSKRKITELGLIKSSACLLPEGAILLCSRATIGDLAIAKKPMATNQGFKNLVCKMDVHNVYLAYLLTTKKSELIEKAIGTTFLEISKKELSKIQVVLPSLPEQRAIAETLSCFDDHIANLAELIEKKKAIREGALEDLVSGKTRLKGVSGEWKEECLESLTSGIITGGTPSTAISTYWGGTIPWLASTEIHQKRITRPTTYITEVGLRNSSAKIVPKNSVLIALAGQGKTRGTAAFLLQDMAINQSLAALIVNEKANARFLFYAMERSYTSLRELSSGDGGRGGLNKKLLKQYTISVPCDVAEQEAIADILLSLDDEIMSLEEEKNKMLQIKAGAMDDLLTGRIRLVRQGG